MTINEDDPQLKDPKVSKTLSLPNSLVTKAVGYVNDGKEESFSALAVKAFEEYFNKREKED